MPLEYRDLITKIDIAGNWSITKRRTPFETADAISEGVSSMTRKPTTRAVAIGENNCTEIAGGDQGAPFLGIVNDLSQGESKPYGERGLTAYGKKMIRRATAIMERKYGKRRLGFLTFSLPEWNNSTMRFLSRYFREMLRKLEQEIRRELQRVGAPPDMVYCVEIQMKRFRRGGGIVPHVHMVVLSRSARAAQAEKKDWYISLDGYKAIWNRIVQDAYTKAVEGGFAAEESRPNYQARAVPQTIKKSATGYMSKYMSKGGGDLEDLLAYRYKHMSEDNPWELPRRWYGISKELRAKAAAAVIEIPHWLWLEIQAFEEGSKPNKTVRSKRSFHVFLEKYGFEKLIAISGLIQPKIIDLLFEYDHPKNNYSYPQPPPEYEFGDLLQTPICLKQKPILC